MKRGFLLIILSFFSFPALAINDSINSILAIGPEGKGNVNAAEAWKKLTSNSNLETLTMVFEAMNKAEPVASNWLRSAAEIIFKNMQTDQYDSSSFLGEYFLNENNPSKARRFAFELIRENDPEVAAEIIPGLLNDPSPELRRDAIDLLIKKGKSLEETGKKKFSYFSIQTGSKFSS
ncbi:MAG: hypothetical protein CMO59_09600 [Verrucomicrobiales bacterium]|nr:hypothetical protein [Verrucomicrobiales bacterium]